MEVVMQVGRLVATMAMLASAGGCLIFNTAGVSRGEVSVGWVFSGGLDCQQAGVSEVLVTLTARSTTAASVGPLSVSCTQGSVVVENIREGDYDLSLDGVTSARVLTHTRTLAVVVVAGQRTDLAVQDVPSLLGVLRLDWSFEDPAGGAAVYACDLAGVQNIRIILTEQGALSAAFDGITECDQEDGVEIADITPGDYWLTVVGLGEYGGADLELYHLDNMPVAIPGEAVTDVGVLVLPLDEHQYALVPGTLRVNWKFQNPAGGAALEDCSLAGVETIRLIMTPQGSATPTFDQDTTCNQAGTDVINLSAGSYLLTVVGQGRYNNLVVPLYIIESQAVTIAPKEITDVGTVELALDASQFGNITVSWTFSDAGSCQSHGVSSLSVSLYRGTTLEDTFTADCSVASTTRTTFVPGDHRITASGTGSDGTYSGEVPVANVAPGQTASFNVSLAKQ
jgi:hypothetical protein